MCFAFTRTVISVGVSLPSETGSPPSGRRTSPPLSPPTCSPTFLVMPPPPLGFSLENSTPSTMWVLSCSVHSGLGRQTLWLLPREWIGGRLLGGRMPVRGRCGCPGLGQWWSGCREVVRFERSSGGLLKCLSGAWMNQWMDTHTERRNTCLNLLNLLRPKAWNSGTTQLYVWHWTSHGTPRPPVSSSVKSGCKQYLLHRWLWEWNESRSVLWLTHANAITITVG